MIPSDMNVDTFYSNFTIDNEQNILDILQIFMFLKMPFTNKAFTLNNRNRVYDYPFVGGNWQVTPSSN